MNHRTTIAVLAAALLGLSACSSEDATTDAPAKVSSQDKPAEESDSGKAETAPLPDMAGKGLQSAQDQAQAAGFYALTSHDALGRDRMQTFDRNWKVCAQAPKAGTRSTDTKVDFATVKLDETCPAKDAGAGEPAAAGATMPDFQGKAVKVARGALDSGASITVNDASGQDRIVFMESNWQVCSQEPAAGAKLDGRPVTLSAVKFDESC
ncbi:MULTISPECIES: PASTA domain-containing protein [unclassified Streptomyces]|uniref:PASTA domain-containing protein n=1 Tax=unclassified Streptomyces TaxID=2593676 RepID=UPI002E18A809|nr:MULTISPECIES: PASTA domain-containing protein [unclassified Streptomyces]